jgi:hypothetical protein
VLEDEILQDENVGVCFDDSENYDSSALCMTTATSPSPTVIPTSPPAVAL